MIPPTDRWIVYRKPRPLARLRLFCFPYAGGGAAIYRDWAAQLPAHIEVCPVQLPGREGRLGEPAFARMDALQAALLPMLNPYLDLPFAFFGHSMGAAVAYETAQRLRATGKPTPCHLLVSARRSPFIPPDDPGVHTLPDAEFKARLRKLNGTPEAVLNHPELMDLLLPLVRADFELNNTYQPPAWPPLDCALTAFGSTDDPEVSLTDLQAWRDLTRSDFQLCWLAGDHFFIHSQSSALLQAITTRLGNAP